MTATARSPRHPGIRLRRRVASNRATDLQRSLSAAKAGIDRVVEQLE